MEASDFRVASYQTHLNSFGEWGFHIAVKRSSVMEPSLLKLANVPRRYLSDELLQSLKVFPSDTERIGSPVNSLFEPKLYMLYEAGLNR
jgi:spermidine synthase